MLVCCTVSALPRSEGPEIRNSTISNTNRNATIEARNGSAVNTGIQARGADIRDSTLSNTFTGRVSAVNRSEVSAGIKADHARIQSSTVTVDTRANISADRAVVRTGVDATEIRNSTVSSSYQGNINAAHSTVEAALIKGAITHRELSTDVRQNIDAEGKSVKIGTISVGGGARSQYADRQRPWLGSSPGGGPAASVGNVEVQTSTVREVNTTVGGSSIAGLRTRSLSKTYSENGGVDNTGTLHVYVDESKKNQVLEKGGSAGDVRVRDHRVRKVETFVE
jgi:hypothetical protein